MNTQGPPEIVVYGSRGIPPAALAAVGVIVGLAIFRSLRNGFFSLALILLVAAGAVAAILLMKRFAPRMARIIIRTDGIDIVARQTGLLRWEELVHVSLFTIPPDGADGLVVFVNETAAERLPPSSSSDLPVFADASLGTKYVVLYGRELECSLRELRDEIEARCRGQTGPLTKSELSGR